MEKKRIVLVTGLKKLVKRREKKVAVHSRGPVSPLAAGEWLGPLQLEETADDLRVWSKGELN